MQVVHRSKSRKSVKLWKKRLMVHNILLQSKHLCRTPTIVVLHMSHVTLECTGGEGVEGGAVVGIEED